MANADFQVKVDYWLAWWAKPLFRVGYILRLWALVAFAVEHGTRVHVRAI